MVGGDGRSLARGALRRRGARAARDARLALVALDRGRLGHDRHRPHPGLPLAAPFPVSRASMRRKIWRDLSGRTGWKRLKATVRRDLGLSRGRVKRNFDAGLDALGGVVVTNGVLLGVLALAGHPALYLLWVGAWLTTYSLAMRLRSIAEHGMVPDPADPLRNTRTTLARWWEPLLLAPNPVN